MDIADTPDDYSPFAVQAALFVVATSDLTDLSEAIDELLLSVGCQQSGVARLADESVCGTTYEDVPYLALSVGAERNRRVDVRLYYHRNAPDELRAWIEALCSAVKRTPGIEVQVYEQVSTGPF